MVNVKYAPADRNSLFKAWIFATGLALQKKKRRIKQGNACKGQINMRAILWRQTCLRKEKRNCGEN